jgi:PhnB protein
MPELNIPSGYQQVMPYLIVKDALGFMKFMQDVFDAKEKMKQMRDENIIMHAEITIGESVIMFADSTEAFPPRTGGFFIYVPDADEAYNKAIAAGATSIMPVSDQPYGRSGGIIDPYGNTWWPTTHITAPIL